MRLAPVAALLMLVALHPSGPPNQVGSVDAVGILQADGSRTNGAGRRMVLPGRPVDAVFSPDGAYAYVKDDGNVRTLRLVDGALVNSVPVPDGCSLLGMAISQDGRSLYVTNAGDALVRFDLTDLTHPKLAERVAVGKFPCGVAVSPDGKTAAVCASVANQVSFVNLATMKVEKTVPTAPAPLNAAFSPDGQGLYVVCQGRSGERGPSAPSGGTQVAVDIHGLSAGGTLLSIHVPEGKVVDRVKTGRQPTAIILSPNGHIAYLSVTNDDRIDAFATAGLRPAGTVDLKDRTGKAGSMPTGLAWWGPRLAVSLAGSARVALVDSGTMSVTAELKTDWYPVSLAADRGRLLCVNLKGLGSRAVNRESGKGRSVADFQGTVTLLTPNDILPPASGSHGYEKQGELPPFHHVVYVIKENRTYDQVFGDIREADGDSDLCVFGEDVTPNQHALAKQFVILDNYYCSGVVSADGHSWATEGNCTPYLERAFGGFGRSYTFGDDPLTYSGSGFIWNAVTASGHSFRNFGEFDYAEPATKRPGIDIYRACLAGQRQEFNQNIGVEEVKRLSSRGYPGWNLNIPDQYRMDRFMDEFKRFEQAGKMPDFIIVYLPQDHTGGPVTPRSMVADNDLAVGRLAEALSHSQFWKDTALIVTEDDPQAGFDHIDGHRSTCLVVSPYSRLGREEGHFYNQCSVLRTILAVFGCPPMNQEVAGSPLMTTCFGSAADLTPFSHQANQIALDEGMPAKNPAASLDLAKHEAQTPHDMEVLNRMVWAYSGKAAPYPSRFAGAHGRGLQRKGLRPDSVDVDD